MGTSADPLLLACGHPISEVVHGDEGTAYCAACEREARADSAPGLVPGAEVEAEAASDEPGVHLQDDGHEREGQTERRQYRREDDAALSSGRVAAHADDNAASRSSSADFEDDPEAEPGSPLDEEPGAGVGADDAHEEQRQDAESEEGAEVVALAPPQPMHGTRAEQQGPRGCWAVKADGTACGSWKRRDSDYCNGHAGISGVGADPTRYVPIAHQARREQLAMRAEMRMVVGDRGRLGPRSLLRAEVNRKAERLVGRAVGAALDEEADPLKAGSLALRLIDAADPPQSASVEISGPLDLDSMSLPELIAFAQANGISLERDPTPPEALEAAE